MKFILSIITILIVYGSLFPFNLSMGEVSDKGIQALLNFDIRKSGFSDLVANIVLFVPFGFFIRATFAFKNQYFAYVVYILVAFLFGYLIQAMQLWTTDRLPWGGDAIFNTIGCAIGVLAHSFGRFTVFQHLRPSGAFTQISFALAAVLIVIKLAPFAPSADFGVLKDNIKALLLNPSIDIYWVFEHTIIWLVAFFLLNMSDPKWATFKRLLVLVVAVLGLKFFIISSNINLSQFVAGLIALGVWRVCPVNSPHVLATAMPPCLHPSIFAKIQSP